MRKVDRLQWFLENTVYASYVVGIIYLILTVICHIFGIPFDPFGYGSRPLPD